MQCQPWCCASLGWAPSIAPQQDQQGLLCERACLPVWQIVGRDTYIVPYLLLLSACFFRLNLPVYTHGRQQCPPPLGHGRAQKPCCFCHTDKLCRSFSLRQWQSCNWLCGGAATGCVVLGSVNPGAVQCWAGRHPVHSSFQKGRLCGNLLVGTPT